MSDWFDADDEQRWQIFIGTPVPEMLRRAEVIAELLDLGETDVGGARRLVWEDGGGQFAVWYFLPDGRAMLLTCDHELGLNVFGGPDDYNAQTGLFDGVPADLCALAVDQPERHPTFNIEGPDGHTVETAGGVFFFDGHTWQISPGVLAYLAANPPMFWTGDEWESRPIAGADLVGEALFQSGFSTCLNDYCFGSDFTADAIMREVFPYELDPDEEQAQRARLAEILARYSSGANSS